MHLLLNNWGENVAILKRPSKRAITEALNAYWSSIDLTVKRIDKRKLDDIETHSVVTLSDGSVRDFFTELLPVY